MATNDFYGDQDLQNIENLSRTQGQQSLLYGDQAAKYADPFMSQRGQYQKQLSDLLANPGSFASSPAYQFSYDQGLNALQRKGSVHSGNKLAALEQYGQDRASQLYFPQAQLLSNLAISGSSPSSAGASYARGTERSQDYNSLAAATRGARNTPAGGAGAPPPTPWWQDPKLFAGNGSTGGPAAGTTPISALPYSSPSSNFSELAYKTGGGYTPSSYAGNNFGSGAYDPRTDPYWGNGVANDVLGEQYDPDADDPYAEEDDA